MAQGFSVSAFAGKISVTAECISHWRQVKKEFSEAVKRGTQKRILFWEGRLPGTSGKDAVPTIFALKNIDPENWKDRHETAVTGSLAGGLALEIAKALAKK